MRPITAATLLLLTFLTWHVITLPSPSLVPINSSTLPEADKYVSPVALYSPRLTGMVLKIAAVIARLPGIGDLVAWKVKQDNDFDIVTRLANRLAYSHLTTHAPLHIPTKEEMEEHVKLAALPLDMALTMPTSTGDGGGAFKYKTARDYVADFIAGRDTPFNATYRIIQILNDEHGINGKLRKPISSTSIVESLRQAIASTKRYHEKTMVGPLDGVPIVIKEELSISGSFQRSGAAGTKFLPLHKNPSLESSSVTRLKKAGLIIVGLTVMHELGTGVTGNNPSVSTPSNPHSLEFYPGGSSSGTAVSVAANLVPWGVGVDGGGSIRIPAALCGTFGLKPTYQRVSDDGGLVVGAIGPMAMSVRDLALAYHAMAGSLPPPHPSSYQPPAHLAHVLDALDEKFSVCIFSDMARDLASDDVFNAYMVALNALRDDAGVTIIERHGIPHVDALRKAHIMTILSEMTSWSDTWWSRHSRDLNAESAVTLSLGRTFTNRDLMNAMRIKTWAIKLFRDMFVKSGNGGCDVLLLPATGIAAPRVPAGGLEFGEGNNVQSSRIMEFSSFANFVGIPAGVAPMGYDGHGLPLSVQVMGDAWQEAKILRVLSFLEKVPQARLRKPDGLVMEWKQGHGAAVTDVRQEETFVRMEQIVKMKVE